MADVEDRFASRIRLARELLASLKAEQSESSLISDSPSPPRDDFEMTETVAKGHQKRDNKRFRYPVLRVLVGTQTYNTLDWSLGGLMVAEFDGAMKRHARIKLSMSDGSKGCPYFAAEGRVTRADPKERVLGVQFTSLSKDGFEWLSRLQLLQRTREMKSKVKQGA